MCGGCKKAERRGVWEKIGTWFMFCLGNLSLDAFTEQLLVATIEFDMDISALAARGQQQSESLAQLDFHTVSCSRILNADE